MRSFLANPRTYPIFAELTFTQSVHLRYRDVKPAQLFALRYRLVQVEHPKLNQFIAINAGTSEQYKYVTNLTTVNNRRPWNSQIFRKGSSDGRYDRKPTCGLSTILHFLSSVRCASPKPGATSDSSINRLGTYVNVERSRSSSLFKSTSKSSADIHFVNKTEEVVIFVALPWKWHIAATVGTGGATMDEAHWGLVGRAYASEVARILQVTPNSTATIAPKKEWDGRSTKIRMLVATKRESNLCVWMQSTVKCGTDAIVFPGLVGPDALPLLGYFPITTSSSSILDAALSAILPWR